MDKKVVMWRDLHDANIVNIGLRSGVGEKLTFQSWGMVVADALTDLFGEHDWECLGTSPMEVDLSVWLNDEENRK